MRLLQTIIRKIAFLLILVVFASCGNNRKQVVIGVSQCSEDIWRNKLNEELLLASYQHENVSLKILSANDDDQLQIKQIEQLADDGVDLLIISPNQVNTITPIIDKVYDRGIPVILFDRKTDGKKYTAFIGADNVEAGRAMGNYIATWLGGKGRVVEIAGLEGSSPAKERHDGFVEALSKHPQVQLVDSRYAGWLKDKGAQQMDSILMKHNDVDFVFAQNDRMAIGASESAKKAGKQGIRFTGIDALPVTDGGLEKVAAGELEASYIYPTRGDLVMQLAMNILEGRPYERENYLKGAIVTRDNAHVLLMQSEEMSKQQGRFESLHERVDTYLDNYNNQKVFLVLLVTIVLLLIALIVYAYYTVIARHRLEAETTQAKLRFFTNVSHELRTPLTLIADPIRQLSKASNLTPAQANTLSIANRNVGILMRLVNDILDFRKVQNGKMKMHASRFDLAEEISAWAQLFVDAAGQKKITLETKRPAVLMVEADKEKLESMCYNLMSNALKYTPEGGHISLTATAKDGAAYLEVENSGKGILPEDLPHLFDRFYQARQNEGGTGIGLALVKAFAELHKGQVSAESTPGQTTRFVASLPILTDASSDRETDIAAITIKPKASYSATQSQASEKLTSVEQEEEKPHLLIIDDNADIRDYVHMLTSARYNVSHASDGSEGLERARKEMPEVIVCDVMMPVMDGLEFCRQLKADPLICHIPVLLLTAKTMAEHQAEGYSQGADAYLTKPFNTEVLLARLENLIKNRRLIKSLFDGASSQPPAERHLSVEDEFVAQFRKVVDANLGDSDCNADKLAAEMGLSRTQLYRKIKAITGKSANDILREARLQKADHLLKTTHKTASEIAYDVGFSSPSYFSKLYKEAFGHTPRETK